MMDRMRSRNAGCRWTDDGGLDGWIDAWMDGRRMDKLQKHLDLFALAFYRELRFHLVATPLLSLSHGHLYRMYYLSMFLFPYELQCITWRVV